MNKEQIKNILQCTLSGDSSSLRYAEEQLDIQENTNAKYCIHLLDIISEFINNDNDNTETVNLCFATILYFEKIILRYWTTWRNSSTLMRVQSDFPKQGSNQTSQHESVVGDFEDMDITDKPASPKPMENSRIQERERDEFVSNIPYMQ